MKLLEQLVKFPEHEWNGNINNHLYHFTSIFSCLRILDSNTIFMQAMIDTDALENGILKYGQKSVSMTTDINFWKKTINGFDVSKKVCCLDFSYKKLKNIKHSKYIYKGDHPFKDPDYSNEKEIRFYDDITDVKQKLNRIFIFSKNNIQKYNINKLYNYMNKNRIEYEIKT